MTATADSGAPGALFAAYLGEKRPQIEAFLATCAPVCVPGTAEPTRADLNRYLYQPLERFTASGGKRTRPALALLGCEAVGADPEAALSTAAAIEYFQSAALIHDDIADKSELRRGEPCTYVTEGTGVAINIGDLGLVNVLALVLRDQKLPADVRSDVAERLVQMEERTLEGQALDLGWARDGRWDISVEDYLYMASHKTAYYSAAVPLVTGALCGGGTPDQLRALDEFGMRAGLAFQLQDDLLNLVGNAEAQGKDFRSDITEGKRTLAVVYALASLDTRDREELVAILEDGTTNADELARAVELIEAGGGIAHCSQLAEREARRAEQGAHDLASRGLVTHEAAELLCAMAQFFVRRAS